MAERTRTSYRRESDTVAQSARSQGGASKAHGVLTVTFGTDVGRVLSLSRHDAVTLGRSDECSHCITEPGLSRVHARVLFMLGRYAVEDLGSTNGTFINDARIQGIAELREGDCLRLGRTTTLRFSTLTEGEAAALRDVYEASTRDGLTGVFNRRHLDERLDEEIAFALRHQAPLSVLLIDLDHFKAINDGFGHLAGDAVLKAAGARVATMLRAEDIVGRYGGEEFMVIARGAGIEGAAALAERLRRGIEACEVVFESRAIRVTASFGVATLETDKRSLIARADQRLYAAKRAGRNRVASAG